MYSAVCCPYHVHEDWWGRERRGGGGQKGVQMQLPGYNVFTWLSLWNASYLGFCIVYFYPCKHFHTPHDFLVLKDVQQNCLCERLWRRDHRTVLSSFNIKVWFILNYTFYLPISNLENWNYTS